MRKERLFALALVGLALMSAVLRFVYRASPLQPDEGGFLLVASQWDFAGDSLYGNYWVDRPPLLLLLFKLAGSFHGLRLLGCFFAFLTVVLLGLASAVHGHRRGGIAAAAVAMALLVSPLAGAVPVNGELLALPFTGAAILLGLHSFQAVNKRAFLFAVGAGAATAGAMFVKQNMVDGGVAFVTLAVFTLTRETVKLTLARCLAYGAGLVGALSLALVGAGALGTQAQPLFYALYPFRLDAGHVLKQSGEERLDKLTHLALQDLSTLSPLLILAIIVSLFWRQQSGGQPQHARIWVVAMLGAYGAFSIMLGGSYWSHYLVQFVPAFALAAGLLVERWRSLGVACAAVVTVAGLCAWAGGLNAVGNGSSQAVGTALAASAKPGDSVVSLLGDAGIVYVSGLPSPYRYQWSLPARTLDPDFSLLGQELLAKERPTWLIIRGSSTRATLDASTAGPPLRAHYRKVGSWCGREVLLKKGEERKLVPATYCERSYSGVQRFVAPAYRGK